MEVKIQDNKLYIEIELQEPQKSSSGKTLVIASTHGNKETELVFNDKKVIIGLNAYIKA